MDKTILVTGATGRQGGAVVRHLLKGGWKVRALTRKPDGAAAKILGGNGVQIVGGDLNDSDSIKKAVSGAHGVFSVQNSWEHGVENEVLQGTLLIEEAARAGVVHFVYSSAASADRSTGIPHFESKWQIEQRIHASGIPSTILRPVFFMENLLAPDTLSAIENGILALGNLPSKPLQMIAVDDIGAYAAIVFDNPAEYLGKAFAIAGDELTGPQMARTLGSFLDRSVEYRQTPIEQIRAFSSDYALMVEWFNSSGYSVAIEELRELHPGLLRFNQWVELHKDILLQEPVHA